MGLLTARVEQGGYTHIFLVVLYAVWVARGSTIHGEANSQQRHTGVDMHFAGASMPRVPLCGGKHAQGTIMQGKA